MHVIINLVQIVKDHYEELIDSTKPLGKMDLEVN